MPMTEYRPDDIVHHPDLLECAEHAAKSIYNDRRSWIERLPIWQSGDGAPWSALMTQAVVNTLSDTKCRDVRERLASDRYGKGAVVFAMKHDLLHDIESEFTKTDAPYAAVPHVPGSNLMAEPPRANLIAFDEDSHLYELHDWTPRGGYSPDACRSALALMWHADVTSGGSVTQAICMDAAWAWHRLGYLQQRATMLCIGLGYTESEAAEIENVHQTTIHRRLRSASEAMALLLSGSERRSASQSVSA